MENDAIISFVIDDGRDKMKDQSNDGSRPLLMERIKKQPDTTTKKSIRYKRDATQCSGA